MFLIITLILIVVFAITGMSAKNTLLLYGQSKKKQDVVRKPFRPSQLINNIPEKFIGKTTYDTTEDEPIQILYEDPYNKIDKIKDLAKDFSERYSKANKKELDEMFYIDNREKDYMVRKKILQMKDENDRYYDPTKNSYVF